MMIGDTDRHHSESCTFRGTDEPTNPEHVRKSHGHRPPLSTNRIYLYLPLGEHVANTLNIDTSGLFTR